jgi:hypothetical protein
VKRRIWFWVGLLIGAAALGGLVVYLVVVGLDAADKVASVLGLFVGLAGLGLAAFGLRSPRPEPDRPAPSHGGTEPGAGGVVQHITSSGQGSLAQGVVYGDIVNHREPQQENPPDPGGPTASNGG